MERIRFSIAACTVIALISSHPLSLKNKQIGRSKLWIRKRFAAEDIPAVRVPLGIPNDYKPFMTRLGSGDLLVVAFCFGPTEGVDGYAERAVFWRSKDGGKTRGPWGFRDILATESVKGVQLQPLATKHLAFDG